MMLKPYYQIILILLVFVYLFIGVLPFARIETDSMAIANACQHIIDTGTWGENVLGHSYHMQSGTYFLIVSFLKLLNVPTFDAYSIITVLAWILFLIFSLLFVSKITETKNWMLLGLLLLLFPEFGSLGYYANSAVIAAAFWMLAFYIALNTKNIWKVIIIGLLLGIAAWFRVDVAFAFPALLVVFFFSTKNFKKSFIWSILVALIALPITLILMKMVNAQVTGFLGYTKYHWKLFGTNTGLGLLDKSLIRTHISYFSSTTLFLILLGFIYLIRQKKWQILILWFMGIVFYYLFGINNNVAPKHLSYFLPFWSIIVIYGIHFMVSLSKIKRALFLSILMVLFVFQYLIGFKISLKNIPYAEEKYATLYPEPELFKFTRLEINFKKVNHVDVVFGTGTFIPTADEITPSSGIIFNPFSYRAFKKKLDKSFSALENYINKVRKDTLYFLITDGSTQFTLNALLSNGFQWQPKLSYFKKEPKKFIFRKNKKVAILYRYMGFKKFDKQSFLNIFDKMPVKEYVAVFLWDWQNYMIREYLSNRNIKLIGNNLYIVRKNNK